MYIATQQDFFIRTRPVIRTVFVIRTTRFSYPHQCVPSHRLKSTELVNIDLNRTLLLQRNNCVIP